ncbi:Exodeoxyribonuclease VII small subunit [Succinivibrio dextrinosolvens]|uniref:exodeoxyribonuclease VII small subunit n=1 Tax=Succinivibrio dextrinosolvens TaxID=83771 RepID=UPI0008EA231D|nr:exodeoxyribonuclease VII small subunit [Succinivibrio dextrinosolvens]SFS85142.1 Exodeoxyribonuclease VII small subunit [Succinivibrio dextrinosolvens]
MADKQMTSLEEKLSELEKLTVQLEEGKLPIDEAIAVYSRGMELAVSCKQSLDSLSQRIQLAKKNAQEAISLENFEPNGSNSDF